MEAEEKLKAEGSYSAATIPLDEMDDLRAYREKRKKVNTSMLFQRRRESGESSK